MNISIQSIKAQLDKNILSVADLLSLRKTLGAPFRLHPLGFISSTLLIEGRHKLRLHYWPVTDQIQQSPHCQIHDHLFEFKSWVVAGAVDNIEYEATKDIGDDFSVYQTEYSEDCSILTKTEAIKRLSVNKRQTYKAGESYTLLAGILHETLRVSNTPAITVLHTTDTSTSAPRVLGPLTGEENYIYNRRLISNEEITEFIRI